MLHWPWSVHGGHHELHHHGQDRKVCWVRSRLGDLKFSESTAWNRDLLIRIVPSTIIRIEWRSSNKFRYEIILEGLLFYLFLVLKSGLLRCNKAATAVLIE